jgi:hypothetical protein
VSERILFAEPGHVAALRRMHLVRTLDRPALMRRIVLAVLVAWVPLLAINLLRLLRGDATGLTFFSDVGANARALLSIPLLIAAEYVVLPRLDHLVAYFRRSLVIADDLPRFDERVARLRRRSAGVWPSAIVFLGAYAIVVLLLAFAPHETLPAWRLSPAGYFSPAGWWQALISLPLFIGLCLAWLWRLGLWIAFLQAVSRLRIRLIAAHPDHAAGLGFLAHSPGAFAVVALAVGIAVAGAMANAVLHAGLLPTEHALVPIATAAVVTLLAISPPLVFMRVLFETWHEGDLHYSHLARELGQAFERKWLDAAARVEEPALSEPDFSATTDLYGVASNVYEMRIFNIDYLAAASVAVAALVPFAPIWIAALPLDELLHAIGGVLL